MSVLVDSEIVTQLERGAIVIEPFHRDRLGTNSYDVHLAPTLRVYKREYEHVKPMRNYDGEAIVSEEIPLDVRTHRDTVDVQIPDDGIVLVPGELYLASTVEYTESHEHLPILNGRSSLGRLGLSVHVTAGTGDVGYRGHWTCELHCIRPIRIYAGMAVGQLLWFTATGTPEVPYHQKTTAKYNNKSAVPQPSMMHQEIRDAGER